MKNIVLTFLIMFSYPAIAAWAGFEVITPENISNQLFTFTTESEGNEEIVFCLSDNNVGRYDGISFLQSAWLVKTSTELEPAQLNFSSHFNGTIDDPNIESSLSVSEDFVEGSDCQMRITVAVEDINRSYIFVGYDQPVMDGGLRYTIQLGLFVK